MKYKNLSIEVQNHIAVVKLNRPEALNALNINFFEEFNFFLDNLSDEIKILIITGEGKAFVAGADIAEVSNFSPAEAEKFSKNGQLTFDKIENLDIPCIAAVNGFALGGGCELAMACDIRIASSNAKFGQPEVNLGIIPGFAGTQRLSRLIGKGNAMYLILSTDMIDAEEAKSIGLVQKVTKPEELLDYTIKLANKILEKGPHAIKAAKHTINKGINMSFSEALKLEAREFSLLFNNDAIEGLKAFVEKRKPNWEK